MKTTLRFLTAAALALPSLVRAQWVTQTCHLNAGWNAVYLHVDLSHTDINSLVQVSDPIEEIWLWNPNQPTTTPASPAGSQWSSWNKNTGPASVLQTLRGNSALLVRVDRRVAAFDWMVKGRPVAPARRWTLTGLNFVGFPTADPAPNFQAFFDADAQPFDWSLSSEIYRYDRGRVVSADPNLLRSSAYRTTPLERDEAYWVRVGEPTNQVFNEYFGPFEVNGSGSSGIRFGDSLGQTRLYLKNMSSEELTVTLRQVTSETPPPGQPAITGPLPLLVRGPINTTDLTFGYTSLTTGAYGWTLAPKDKVGSEVEVVLGINRAAMTGPPGALFAGTLRFTDSLGLTRVDIGASAITPSRDGLWVGSASVEYVSQYLKPYAKAASPAEFENLLRDLKLVQGVNGYRYEWEPNSGRVLVFGAGRTGSYLLRGAILRDEGGVARPFPLRLIVHHGANAAGAETSQLLQRAYIGLGANSNLVVATTESALLPSALDSARRVSAVHLPAAAAAGPWTFTGAMEQGATLSTAVVLGYDDPTNPFVHAYHPDHDNLDAQFAADLNPGVESFTVRRVISLQFAEPLDDFGSLTRGGSNLGGSYAETITFQAGTDDLKEFNVRGTFNLARINDVATLTTTP